MDVFYAYTYSTAAWFGIQAVPLMMFPKLIITALSTEARKPTVLEEYLCRSLAFTLFTLAILIVLLTGTIPLSSSLSESEITADPSDPKAPYAVPTLTVTATFHAITAFYSYMQYTRHGQIGFALSEIGSGFLASMGCWCLVFGTEKGRISKRTGADKRTSGWPFKNEEADKKKGRKRL
ncbi:MAG: hypothetical protein L6R38_005279 [Xanthoria sp. 2 TBL-2021]|nr:MAG: hypothetical protein L6R38_005279 [Xanthoria sp. 2 TBL-2021]